MSLEPREQLEIRDWREAAAMGLPWKGKPMGALLCVEADGTRCTVVTEDIEYHRMLVGADGLRTDLEIPPEKYPVRKDLWPGDRGWGAS